MTSDSLYSQDKATMFSAPETGAPPAEIMTSASPRRCLPAHAYSELLRRGMRDLRAMRRARGIANGDGRSGQPRSAKLAKAVTSEPGATGPPSSDADETCITLATTGPPPVVVLRVL